MTNEIPITCGKKLDNNLILPPFIQERFHP